MSQTEIILPAMGEGIIEAEITRWLVQVGDHVEVDTPVVEVATDKVDSEIPSPGTGIIHKILMAEGDVPKVGQVIALIMSGATEEIRPPEDLEEESVSEPPESPYKLPEEMKKQREAEKAAARDLVFENRNLADIAFLSPVIRKIATENRISPAELQSIKGTGKGGRITRADLLEYLATTPREPKVVESVSDTKLKRDLTQSPEPASAPLDTNMSSRPSTGTERPVISRDQVYGTGESTIEEMDRMRRLIADHMVYSKQTAPHVTSFVESDVSEMIRWRERIKEAFLHKYNQKITITTLIVEAVAKSLKDFPGINVSLDGYQIIRKASINIGMATALPDGNLIVPVIRNADQMNLPGLAAEVNDLAGRARSNKLQPAEIQGGTFTITNLGNFGNIAGTPVINQPEVAILAVGAIQKKPAVVETPEGDAIGIRQMVILSLTFDHRIVDGELGGSFLKRVGNTLQNFDPGRSI
jgi:2-oxoglutarate dehydrogenase E2 component (dihydrolipoamide succinyltransferase)